MEVCIPPITPPHTLSPSCILFACVPTPSALPIPLRLFILLSYIRGTGLSSPENPDETEAALNAEIDKLNRQELQLDENLRTVQADLKRLAEESANSRFVTLYCSLRPSPSHPLPRSYSPHPSLYSLLTTSSGLLSLRMMI